MSFQDQEITRLYWEYSKRSTNYKSGKKIQNFRHPSSIPLVADFSPTFFTWLNMILQTYQEKTGQDPSLEELAKEMNEIFLSYPKSLFLMITFEEYTQKELDKILTQVKNRLKKRVIKKRFMKDELERYLKVFDLRKSGLKWKEVFLDVHDKMNEKDFTEHRRRALQNDLKRAKTIIRNIENNKLSWWT